jgi:type 1 glutamine amidotransferase
MLSSSPHRQAEEVYHFRSDPRSVGAVVLMTVDEDSYERELSSSLAFPLVGIRQSQETDKSSLFDADTGSSTGNYPPMGDPHPIAWYQERGAAVEDTSAAGRSFFTSLGHTNETWQVSPSFLSRLHSPYASCHY